MTISPMIRISAVMFPMGMVEATVVEVSGVVSVEEGAIVFKIDPVAIVTTPGRIVIVSISGVICFTYFRSGVVATVICGGRCGVYGCGNGSAHINTGSRDPETNMRTDEYLRIAFSSDEAGSYNGGEH